MNSADDDEVDPSQPVAGITTQIIDYYNRFGQNRDLEQYFSLTTATGETVNPTSLLTVPDTGSNTFPLTSGLTSYKQQTNPKSTTVQIDRAKYNVNNLSTKESDSENIKLSEDSETSKDATGLNFDTSLTKAPSPTSSIASQRKLEWDSLADVGYPTDVKTTDIELCTLERMALQQYTDGEKPLHVKFMPLPTAQSTPLDDAPSKPRKLKGKGKKHMAADSGELSTSKIETHNVSSFPGNINVNLTKNISLNLFTDNGSKNDIKVTSKDVPLVSNIEHSPNNVSSVLTEKIDREIQTSLRRDSPEVPNKRPVECKPDVGDNINKYAGPIIVNIQKMKYPVYTKSNWRMRSNLHRRKLKLPKDKVATKIAAPEIEPITEETITSQELRDHDAQLSNADSFEYVSGQLYTEATTKKEDSASPKNAASDKPVTSDLARKLTTPSTTSDSSKSFKKDLEGSIELLSNLLERKHRNSELKKRLIKKVVDKLLSSNYSSDKSASGLNENSSRSTESGGDKSTSSKIDESSIKPILKRQISGSSSHSAPEPLISQTDNEFIKKPYSTYSLDIESRLKHSRCERLPSFSSEELSFGAKSSKNSTPGTDSSKEKSSLLKDKLKYERPFDKYLLAKNKDLLNSENGKAKDELGEVERLLEDLITVKLDGGGDVGERPKGPKHHTVFTLTGVDTGNQPSTSMRQQSNQGSCKEKMNLLFQRYKPGGRFSFRDEATPGTSGQNPQTHFCCCPYHQPENCSQEQADFLQRKCTCMNREMSNDCDHFPDNFVLLPDDDCRQNIECMYANVGCYDNEKGKIGTSEVEQRTICYNGSGSYLTSASASTSNLNSERKDYPPIEIIARICPTNVRTEPSPQQTANKIKRSEGTVKFSTATDVTKGKEIHTRSTDDTNNARRRYTSPAKSSDRTKSSRIPQEHNKKTTNPLKKCNECPDKPIQNNVNQNISCPLQRQTKSPERTATKQTPCPGVKKKGKEKIVRTTEHNTIKTTAKTSHNRSKAMQTSLSINPKVTEPKLSDIHMLTASSPSTSPSSFAKSGKSDPTDQALCTCKTCDKCGRTKHNAENNCPALEMCSKLLLEAQKFDQKLMENSQTSAKVHQKSVQSDISTRNVATSYSSQIDDGSVAESSQETPSQMEHDSSIPIEKEELNKQVQTNACPICGKVHSPSNSADTSKTKNSSGDSTVTRSSIKNAADTSKIKNHSGDDEATRSSIKKNYSQQRPVEPSHSEVCPICGKVHSHENSEMKNDSYKGNDTVRKPNPKTNTASSPEETRKFLNRPPVQSKVTKQDFSNEICRKSGNVHNELSKPTPGSNSIQDPVVSKPAKMTMNRGVNRQIVEEMHQAILDSSKGTSTSRSKSDTDTTHFSSNNQPKSTEHDILIEMIKSIISRYSKINSDDVTSRKNSKTKTRKEILRELRYLLNTHSDDVSQSCGNENESAQAKGKCAGAESEQQCSSPPRNSGRQKSKPHAHNMQFNEESTDQTPSSRDSYTYKLMNHFKNEYDKLLRRHCKCLSCENCDLSCNLDANGNPKTRCHKSKRQPRVLKKSVAYNLIIQSSDSFDNVSQDENKHKSRLKEVVIKIPKNSRLIPRVASDSRIDYDDLSSDRQKVRRSANNKHVTLLEMTPEYLGSDGRTESKSHSEAPRSKDVDQEISVQRYLEINRPDFFNNTERRQETIKEIQNERISRAKVKRMLVSMQLSEARNVNTLTLEDMRTLAKEVGLRPSRSVSNEKLTMERKMKRHSEKIYNKLPEVTRKKEQMKKDRIKKTNLIMQQIFTKSLQKKTLRGHVDVPHCSSIIKI